MVNRKIATVISVAVAGAVGFIVWSVAQELKAMETEFGGE